MTTRARDNPHRRATRRLRHGQGIELLGLQIERLEHHQGIRVKLREHLPETRGQRAALDHRPGRFAAAHRAISLKRCAAEADAKRRRDATSKGEACER